MIHDHDRSTTQRRGRTMKPFVPGGRFTGLTMDARWNTSSTGTEQARADLPACGSRVWLRAAADGPPSDDA